MPRFTKEQQLAIDLEGSNILVSAGAGSGKTAVLSQRVLRKVESNVSVDNLLVLTFTNAAAAEMKERIRDKILDSGYYEQALKVESSYITTFDSFTLSIVKKYHYKKNLSKNVQIVDNGIITLKKKEILDNLFESLYKENDKNFLKLITDYSFKNDNEIYEFIKSTQKEMDLIYYKKEFFDNYLSKHYSDDNIINLVNRYTNIILKELSRTSELFISLERIDKEYTDLYKDSLDKLFNSKNYDEIVNNYFCEFKIKRNTTDEFKETKSLLVSSLKTIKSYLKYNTITEYITEYKDSYNSVKTILDIIREYDSRITKYKLDNNLYEFIDIEKLAIDIIRDNEDVQAYYKNKFNEILIDEYQDTSDIQEIFVELISNNNVYMVGDIKQSIYRFRNANPDIFRDKFNNYGKNINGRRIDLNKNFRSREEVLSNINLIFNYLMDNNIGGANYELEHQLSFGNNTYNKEGYTGQNNNFEVLNYEYDKTSIYSKDEIEIFSLVHDIKNKVLNEYTIFDKDTSTKRAIKYSDIAILIDKSKKFELIKKIFTYEKIPLIIYSEESIKDSINIKIIKNLLILVKSISNNTYDRDFKYSFTSILRSYLYEFTDEEIINILEEKSYYNTDLYSKLKIVSKNYDDKTIYNVVNELIDIFNIYESLIKIGNIVENTAVLEYLIDLSKNVSNIFLIEEFINYLDNVTYGDIEIKYNLTQSNSDAVKLMTIHKSKGLEYPIVYFPFLNSKFNDMDIKSKFVFNQKLGFIIPSIKDISTSSFLKELLKEDFKYADISERLRLFYVALTRAKEKYIFIINYENKKDYELTNNIINDYDRLRYNSFKSILESVNRVLTPYIKQIDIDSLNIHKEYMLVKKTNYKELLKKVDTKYLVEEKVLTIENKEEKSYSKKTKKLFTSKEKENIKLGLEYHKVFENINFLDLQSNIIESKYKYVVNNFLKQDILKDAINFYKEYEFMYEYNNVLMHGIVDLLIEKEDEFIIIDYKLNDITDENYIKQLNGYKLYIESISNKRTSIYLYSLIKAELKEIT